MAGTLTLSTLSDGTNSTSATNAIQGSAKAWVTFNGTNGSIYSSYNVSSVTRNGTGSAVVTFTNAFADTNYCVTGAAQGIGMTLATESNTYTTSAFETTVWRSGTSFDRAYVYVAVFR